jgi:hypothetical protein
LEATFSNILVVSVDRVFAVNIIILDVLWQSKNNRREAGMKVSMLILRASIIKTYQSTVYRVQNTFLRVSQVNVPKAKRFCDWCRPSLAETVVESPL